MRPHTLPLIAALLGAASLASAEGNAPDELGQLRHDVAVLKQQVAALNQAPDDRAEAREARGRGEQAIANQARAVEDTIAYGQGDVGDSLRELRSALGPYEQAALEDANQVEAAHVRRAMEALAEAQSQLGSEDLFRSRESIDLALYELERARDQALSD